MVIRQFDVSTVAHSIPLIGSRRGISPPRSHRTVSRFYGTGCESLPSHSLSRILSGALHVDKPLKHRCFHGHTNNQCANRSGRSLYLVFKYVTLVFLYSPFSHFTHFSSRALSCRQTSRRSLFLNLW